jgi:hypothetical protein
MFLKGSPAVYINVTEIISLCGLSPDSWLKLHGDAAGIALAEFGLGPIESLIVISEGETWMQKDAALLFAVDSCPSTRALWANMIRHLGANCEYQPIPDVDRAHYIMDILRVRRRLRTSVAKESPA